MITNRDCRTGAPAGRLEAFEAVLQIDDIAETLSKQTG